MVLFYFFLTFLASRIYVNLAIKGIVPESLTQDVRGVHVHHFAYGILINTIVGFLALTLPLQSLEKWKIKLAAIYGIGTGWTFDEFGMWLRLEDQYWVRTSYDAIIIIGIILINITYLGSFWVKLFGRIAKDINLKSLIPKPPFLG